MDTAEGHKTSESCQSAEHCAAGDTNESPQRGFREANVLHPGDPDLRRPLTTSGLAGHRAPPCPGPARPLALPGRDTHRLGLSTPRLSAPCDPGTRPARSTRAPGLPARPGHPASPFDEPRPAAARADEPPAVGCAPQLPPAVTARLTPSGPLRRWAHREQLPGSADSLGAAAWRRHPAAIAGRPRSSVVVSRHRRVGWGVGGGGRGSVVAAEKSDGEASHLPTQQASRCQ